MLAVGALLMAGAASAQPRYRYYYEPYPGPYYTPFELNLWAGLSTDLLNCSGCTAQSASSHFGSTLGGDVGFRLSRHFGVVALGEYNPIFNSYEVGDVYSVGAGLRFDPSRFSQLLLAATYSQLDRSSATWSSAPGVGFRFYGFFPLGYGFGPYFQVTYQQFSPIDGPMSLFTVNGGLSFSY
jgi:hypothetical protein